MMDKTKVLQEINKRCENTLMETLEIEFIDIGDDFATAQMPVNSRVHQPYGILHGGATAALAETVASFASTFFVDGKTEVVKGIQLSINHLKSKKEGMVFATARSVHKGRTTHLWEVKIVDEVGAMISICKMTNIVLKK